MPSDSANCMAIEARLPPMSVLPSTRFTVPSGLTAAAALDCPPQLNHMPAATPRPRPLARPAAPVVRDSAGGQQPPARFQWPRRRGSCRPSGRRSPSATALRSRNSSGSMPSFWASSSTTLSPANTALVPPGARYGCRLGPVHDHVVAVDQHVVDLVGRKDNIAGRRLPASRDRLPPRKPVRPAPP